AYTDRYDVITAEPPPPNHAGVVNLYSRELYRLARQRLTAGGVITQWLPVFQLSPSDIRSMIAAFTAELPHTALLYGYSQELILIGGNAPLHIDSERVPSRQVQADLMHSGIESLADIAGAQLLNDGQLRRLVTGVEPLSDDRPSLQYPWESLSDTPSYALLFGVRESEGPQTPAALATRRALIALNAPATNPERDELAFGNAVARALAARPRSEALLALLGVEEETASLAARALSRPGVGALLALDDAAATAMQKRAERDVVHGAAITVARRAFYRGQWERALALLDAFAPPRGWLPSRELLAGTALRALGRSDAARQRLQHAAELSTDREAQRTLHALAEQAAQPLDADLGPFGLRSIRSRH
ncbi:MAG TPA: hypothetical protein VHM19_13205, partial [Polyangiales bacterium]|nr:hypothetical protein [Polyangiales bacterium]